MQTQFIDKALVTRAIPGAAGHRPNPRSTRTIQPCDTAPSPQTAGRHTPSALGRTGDRFSVACPGGSAAGSAENSSRAAKICRFRSVAETALGEEDTGMTQESLPREPGTAAGGVAIVDRDGYFETSYVRTMYTGTEACRNSVERRVGSAFRSIEREKSPEFSAL